ncbi:MAG: stage III sporulation protein AE [Firmicutes bacterium]|nr:stage III sporulation protein AE [Bacillota bacterium]
MSVALPVVLMLAVAAWPDGARAAASAQAPVAQEAATASSGSQPGRPASPDDIVRAQMDAMDTAALESFLRDVDADVKEFFPELDLAGMLKAPRGAAGRLEPGRIAAGIVRLVAAEVRASLALLGQLIVLAVMCSVLSEFASGLGAEQATGIARAACFMVLAVMAINSFLVTTRVATAAVDRMTSFVHSATPLLFALLAAAGGVTSAAVMSPAVVAAAGATSGFVNNLVFPLIFLSAVLEVTSMITERVQLTRLSALLRDGAVAALGGFMTLFVGVMAVRGVGAAVTDTLSIRAAKFVSGTFIPVVGKMFSDAVAMVASCSVLIQSGLTVVGLLGVFMICLVPAAKIFAVAAMYKVAGAVVQPMGDEQLARCLGALGNTLVMVLVSLAVSAFAFIAAMTVVAGLANLTAAMR